MLTLSGLVMNNVNLFGQFNCDLNGATVYFNGEEVPFWENLIFTYPCRDIGVCVHFNFFHTKITKL